MKYEIHPDLKKVLLKLAKRDLIQFDAASKKIERISSSDDLRHYKNLKSPLNKYKRVHVKSSFVLLYYQEKDKIIFRHYGHHDDIYK